MDTVAKGNEFEAKIHALFRDLVSEGAFYINPNCCKIYTKKGYYSKDREKEIVFDISIEAFLPGANEPSMIIIIECKNYNHKVPVDDAEEFFSKIQQVSGAKGIIASTSAFQEGTLKFCKSKKIGLLKYFDETHFKWELNRSQSSKVFWSDKSDTFDIYSGFTLEEYKSKKYEFFFSCDEVYTNSPQVFIDEVLKEIDQDFRGYISTKRNDNRSKISVEYISPEAIEEIVEDILSKVKYQDGEVPLKKICDWQLKEKNLKLRLAVRPSKHELSENILGRIDFQASEIAIFNQPGDTLERQRFTLAHELGHYFLGHSKYIVREYCQEHDFDFIQKADSSSLFVNRLEWQANQFAASLLLPRSKFMADFLSLAQDLGLKDRGFGLLYVDHQKCNLSNYYRITDALIEKYKVSRTVISIRLKKFNFLNDNRDRATNLFGLSRLF